jgi:hypothetical protein
MTHASLNEIDGKCYECLYKGVGERMVTKSLGCGELDKLDNLG